MPLQRTDLKHVEEEIGSGISPQGPIADEVQKKFPIFYRPYIIGRGAVGTKFIRVYIPVDIFSFGKKYHGPR